MYKYNKRVNSSIGPIIVAILLFITFCYVTYLVFMAVLMNVVLGKSLSIEYGTTIDAYGLQVKNYSYAINGLSNIQPAGGVNLLQPTEYPR